jgi:hypothetical protein
MKNSFVGMHYYKGHGIGNQEGPASKSQDRKTKAILNKKNFRRIVKKSKKQVRALQGKGIRKILEEGGREHYHKKAVRPGMKNISTRAAYGLRRNHKYRDQIRQAPEIHTDPQVHEPYEQIPNSA